MSRIRFRNRQAGRMKSHRDVEDGKRPRSTNGRGHGWLCLKNRRRRKMSRAKKGPNLLKNCTKQPMEKADCRTVKKNQHLVKLLNFSDYLLWC